MARISDRRVIQFWDKDHLIAKQLDARLHTKQPSCCWRSGTLWDLVALYPAGTKWNESEPFYIDGPIVKVENELQKEASRLLQSHRGDKFSISQRYADGPPSPTYFVNRARISAATASGLPNATSYWK